MAKTDAQLRNEAFVANLTAQVEAAVEQELSETPILQPTAFDGANPDNNQTDTHHIDFRSTGGQADENRKPDHGHQVGDT